MQVQGWEKYLHLNCDYVEMWSARIETVLNDCIYDKAFYFDLGSQNLIMPKCELNFGVPFYKQYNIIIFITFSIK